jgi:hypothetical protein
MDERSAPPLQPPPPRRRRRRRRRGRRRAALLVALIAVLSVSVVILGIGSVVLLPRVVFERLFPDLSH